MDGVRAAEAVTAANPGAWGRDQATYTARARRVSYLTTMGWTARQIADDMGVTTRTVYAYRRRVRGEAATTTAAVEPGSARAARAVQLYTAGKSMSQVAAELDVTKNAVYWLLTCRGLVRSRVEAARVRYPEPAHGTRARRERGCECGPCVDAKRVYGQAWRTARRERTRDAV